ncbi:MAG: hypothetical protein QGD94_12280, partial [Planctomycetia bacterium]|nr:hypothetical protein [Planctomycetia bacterium]
IRAVAQEEPAEHVADGEPPEEPAEEVLMVELADERQADLPVETQDVAPVPVRLEMEQADAETVEAEVEEGEEPGAPASVPEVTAARPEEARTLRCARCGAAVTAEQAESIDEPGGPGRWHGKLVCSECLVKVKAIDADGGEGLEPHEQQRVLLQRVLHEVRRLARRTEAQPFSLLRLFAYLAMIVSLFVGLVLVIVVEQKGLFIQMGILLMLLALTLFIIEKKR